MDGETDMDGKTERQRDRETERKEFVHSKYLFNIKLHNSNLQIISANFAFVETQKTLYEL